MYGFQYLGISALFQQSLFYFDSPGPATHHADIGMLFFHNLFQTHLIVTVASGHNDKIGIPIPGDFFQPFFKRLTEHSICTGSSGIVGKFGAVFQDCDSTADHTSDLDHWNGYMTGAADHQLLFMRRKLTEDPCTVLGDNTGGRNIRKIFGKMREESFFSGLPLKRTICKKSLFTCCCSIQSCEDKALAIGITGGDEII